jgi:hypothetical protein
MIAYVALIPVIRSKLPPSPSLTMVEIVIYISTTPNFLAVMSVYIVGALSYLEFFKVYEPFLDTMFMMGFLITSISFVIMVLLIMIYISKQYITDYTIRKYKPATMERICAPFYL